MTVILLLIGVVVLVLSVVLVLHYHSFKRSPVVENNYENFFCPSYDKQVQLHYRVFGKGPIKVLFVVGLASNYLYWLPQVQYIEQAEENAQEYTVCVFDNRGSGKSTTPKGWRISVDTMARDTIALVEHLGWDTFHLVGQSMGGLIAQRAAFMLCNKQRYDFMSRNQTHVESLTLVNTFTHVFTREGLPQKSCIKFLLDSAITFSSHALVDKILDQMFTQRWLNSQNVLLNQTQRQVWHRILRNDMFTSAENCRWGTAKQVLGILSYYPGTDEELAQLAMHIPILLVGCEGDLMVHSSNTHRLYKMYSNVTNAKRVQIVWMQAGHIVPIEQAKEFNQLLYREWIPQWTK